MAPIICQWRERKHGVVCVRCGTLRKTPRIRQCDLRTPGLGDCLALALKAVGITKRRYQYAKRRLGLATRCGCHRRQQRLNRIGRWLAFWRRWPIPRKRRRCCRRSRARGR